jgi:hypothetical protein
MAFQPVNKIADALTGALRGAFVKANKPPRSGSTKTALKIIRGSNSDRLSLWPTQPYSAIPLKSSVRANGPGPWLRYKCNRINMGIDV